MTLTTERLREIAECRSPSLRWGEAEKIAAELLANREAQPVGFISAKHGPVLYGEHIGLPAGKHFYTAPPAPAVPDERAAFNAWNNEDNLPIAGIPAKNAAWLAWLARAMLSHVGDATDKVEPVMICDTCGHDADHQGNRTYKCDNGHVFHMRRERQGCKLVPVEPTPKQWAAGVKAMITGMDKVTLVYKAMLATAPTQGENQ